MFSRSKKKNKRVQGKSIIRLNSTIFLLAGGFLGTVYPFAIQVFDLYYSSIATFIAFLICSIVMGTVFGYLAVLVNKHTILRSIHLTVADMERLSQEELDFKKFLFVRSDDSVGSMTRSFNSLLQKIHSALKIQQSTVHELYESSIRFNSSLRYAEKTLTTTMVQVTDLSKNCSLQQKTVFSAKSSLSSYIQQLDAIKKDLKGFSHSFRDFSQSIFNSNTLSQSLVSSVESLSQSTGNTDSKQQNLKNDDNSLIGVTMNFVKESHTVLASQGKRLFGIGKLLREIEDIAESTHLLSINASIEAARTGEAGRGFTIIALQIRNLATTSGALTSQIKEKIGNIVDETEHSNTHMSSLYKHLVHHIQSTTAVMRSLVRDAQEIQKTVSTMQSMYEGVRGRIESVEDRFIMLLKLREEWFAPLDLLAVETQVLSQNAIAITQNSTEVEKITESFIQNGIFFEKQVQKLNQDLQNLSLSSTASLNLEEENS